MNRGSRVGRGVIGRLLLMLGLAFLGLAALAAVALLWRAGHTPGRISDVPSLRNDPGLIAPGEHVQRDVAVLTGDVSIGAAAIVAGNVTAIGGTVSIAPRAVITGDVTTQSGAVTIAGHVTGNVTTQSGDIVLAPTARVDHAVLSTSGNVYKIPGAQVAGTSNSISGHVYNGPPAPVPSSPAPAEGGGSGFLNLLLRLFAAGALTVLALLAGGLVLVVAPRPVARVEATLEHAFLASAIVGLPTAVLLPIVAAVVFFVLSFTLIGPFVAGFLGLAAGFLGLVGLGLWIGERLAQSGLGTRIPQSPLARGLLGLLLILLATDLLGLVWIGLGFLLIYLLGCLGLGAVVLSRFGTIVPVQDQALPFGLRRPTHPLAGSSPPDSERKAS